MRVVPGKEGKQQVWLCCSFFLGYQKQWQSCPNPELMGCPRQVPVPALQITLKDSGVWFGPCLWLSKKPPHKQGKSQGEKWWHALGVILASRCQWMWHDSLGPHSPVCPSTTPWLLPLFLLSTKRKIMAIISHDLPCFPAYAPLTLEEKANYTELHIKFFTYICTGKMNMWFSIFKT